MRRSAQKRRQKGLTMAREEASPREMAQAVLSSLRHLCRELSARLDGGEADISGYRDQEDLLGPPPVGPDGRPTLSEPSKLNHLRACAFNGAVSMLALRSVDGPYGVHEFTVNNVTVHLKAREFIVAAILARFCVVRNGDYISTVDIAETIPALNRFFLGPDNHTPILENATWQDVHRLVSSIRAAIKAAGGPEHVVQTGSSGGYRLQVPFWSIHVEVPWLADELRDLFGR